jgi:hypothetical protein
VWAAQVPDETLTRLMKSASHCVGASGETCTPGRTTCTGLERAFGKLQLVNHIAAVDPAGVVLGFGSLFDGANHRVATSSALRNPSSPVRQARRD